MATVQKPRKLMRGEFIKMSPEEQKAHTRAQQLYWRNTPKGRAKVKADNARFSRLYSETKPFLCTCHKCGKEFFSSRNSHKTCPDCQKIPTESAINRYKRQQHRARLCAAIAMGLIGMSQTEIGKRLEMSQSAVGALFRRRGIHETWKQRKEGRK